MISTILVDERSMDECLDLMRQACGEVAVPDGTVDERFGVLMEMESLIKDRDKYAPVL